MCKQTVIHFSNYLVTFSLDSLVVEADGFEGSALVFFKLDVVLEEERLPLAGQADELVALLVMLDLDVVLEVGRRADLEVVAL